MIAEVERLSETWYAAWLSKDAATVERLMAKEYVYVAPNGQVLDRDAILAIIRSPTYQLYNGSRTDVVVTGSERMPPWCGTGGKGRAPSTATLSRTTTVAPWCAAAGAASGRWSRSSAHQTVVDSIDGSERQRKRRGSREELAHLHLLCALAGVVGLVLLGLRFGGVMRKPRHPTMPGLPHRSQSRK